MNAFRKYPEKQGPVSPAEAIGKIMAENREREKYTKQTQTKLPDRRLYVALGYEHTGGVSGIAELTKREGDYALSNPQQFLDDKFKLEEPMKTNFPENSGSLDNVIKTLRPDADYLLIVRPAPNFEGDLRIQPAATCEKVYTLNRS